MNRKFVSIFLTGIFILTSFSTISAIQSTNTINKSSHEPSQDVIEMIQ